MVTVEHLIRPSMPALTEIQLIFFADSSNFLLETAYAVADSAIIHEAHIISRKWTHNSAIDVFAGREYTSRDSTSRATRSRALPCGPHRFGPPSGHAHRFRLSNIDAGGGPSVSFRGSELFGSERQTPVTRSRLARRGL